MLCCDKGSAGLLSHVIDSTATAVMVQVVEQPVVQQVVTQPVVQQQAVRTVVQAAPQVVQVHSSMR